MDRTQLQAQEEEKGQKSTQNEATREGAKHPDAETQTTAMLGNTRNDPMSETRREWASSHKAQNRI